MKVLIITWMKYNNFGTVLQAYALQKKIKLLGYDVKTADDHAIGFDIIDKKNKNFFYMILKIIYIILRYPFNRKNRKKITDKSTNCEMNKFDEFKSRYMDIEMNVLDVRYLNNKYQCFIAGSDQIWSPKKEIFSKFYYLDFVSNYNSKISYAPSMGQIKCPKYLKEKIKLLLDDFESISVREKQGRDILSEITNKRIEVVLDPTLLLSKNDWDEIASEKLYEDKYIFCYFLNEKEWYRNYVENISKILNKKVIILNNNEIIIDNKKQRNKVGPSEFISYIKYADYVVTDSFHGTIFSLIYNKEFVCLKRFDDSNSKNNQNSRLYNLLSIVDLDERFIDSKELKLYIDKRINYNQVEKRLKNELNKSNDYLVNSLKNAKGNRVITSNCTGCMACYYSCPVNAIEIGKDEYGEYKPFINHGKCIKCGKCKKICPENKKIELNEAKNCYAAIGNDKEEIKDSTSGGAAYLISKQFIIDGGIVYACVINDNKVNHIRIDNVDALNRTKGSKYSQSIIYNVYGKIKEDLKNNKKVLFIGNPCQVAGIKTIINNENLYLIDLACHGNVPTDYLAEYVQKINKDIKNIKFRNKKEYRLTLINSKSKIVYNKDKNKDAYLYAFLNNISLKESCYYCKYATKKRVGDITLGDFWSLKEKENYSIVLVNSEKGKDLIARTDRIVLIEKDYEQSIENNDSYNHPQGKSEIRLNFNNYIVKNKEKKQAFDYVKYYMKFIKAPKIIRKIYFKINYKLDRIKRNEF